MSRAIRSGPDSVTSRRVGVSIDDHGVVRLVLSDATGILGMLGPLTRDEGEWLGRTLRELAEDGDR